MDISALLGALRTGELVRFAQTLRWEADQYEEITWEGRTGVIALLGVTEIGVTPDGQVSIHTHEDAVNAERCFTVTVTGIRQMMAVAKQMNAFMARMANGDAGQDDNPLVSMVVPDDLSALDG